MDNTQADSPRRGEWATVGELCEIYNVSRSTVHRWIKGTDTVRYFLKANTFRVNREDFDALVQGFVEETMNRNQKG
ncbi:helix-turn-helix domain-containing protein [Corynebacterium afermentans]